MYNNIPTRVLTGECRLSYVNLVQPRANNNDPSAKPKYSVTLLIPKTDTAVYQNILSSIEAAAADAQGKLWNGVRPPVMPIPIHDGDGVRDNGTPYGPECKGCWVITASSNNKPQVIHQSDINTELAPQDIYSGMYARVTINFFGYNRAGKRGIGCGLGNVMKTRDGGLRRYRSGRRGYSGLWRRDACHPRPDDLSQYRVQLPRPDCTPGPRSRLRHRPVRPAAGGSRLCAPAAAGSGVPAGRRCEPADRTAVVMLHTLI